MIKSQLKKMMMELKLTIVRAFICVSFDGMVECVTIDRLVMS
jgi:hypothetical protein